MCSTVRMVRTSLFQAVSIDYIEARDFSTMYDWGLQCYFTKKKNGNDLAYTLTITSLLLRINWFLQCHFKYSTVHLPC